MSGPQAARARRDTSWCHGSFRGKHYEGPVSLSRVNRNEWQNPFRNGRKGRAEIVRSNEVPGAGDAAVYRQPGKQQGADAVGGRRRGEQHRLLADVVGDAVAEDG